MKPKTEALLCEGRQAKTHNLNVHHHLPSDPLYRNPCWVILIVLVVVGVSDGLNLSLCPQPIGSPKVNRRMILYQSRRKRATVASAAVHWASLTSADGCFLFSCVDGKPGAADVLRQIYENKHLALLARGTYGYCLGFQHIHISHTLPTVCSPSQWQIVTDIIHTSLQHCQHLFLFCKRMLRNHKQAGFTTQTK